jgi:hypothetical protein
MYEISNGTGQYCIECGKELGYLDPLKRKFYSGSIEVQSCFSTKLHPKFKKTRKRCFDCAVFKFGSISYKPNVHHSDFTGYLFDEEIDKSNVGVTLEVMIKRYGEDEGKKRFESYRSKQAYSNTFEYKKEKHGWTKEEFDEFNSSRAVTLENLTKKHGSVEGKKRYEKYKKRQAYTNSLDYFIEKLGYDNGKKEYERINSEKGLTLENMIRVHGFVKGPQIYEEIISKKSSDVYHSKISQKLFDDLDNIVVNDNTFYASKNNEFGMCSNDRYYFFDYTIPERKKIIEFNGDYWHANPKIYESSWIHPVTKKTAHEIWCSDSDKIDFARKKGYSVMIVWESDFINSPDKVIQQCLEFLNEN